MGFVFLSAKNMLRHRTRTVLTLTSILISVGVLFAVVSYDLGFSRAMDRELGNTGIHITLVPTGCPHEAATLLLHGSVIPRNFDQDMIFQAVNLMEGKISSLHPILITQGLNIDADETDIVFGLDRGSIAEFKPGWSLSDGSFPAGDNELLLGYTAASQYSVQPGDTITYMTHGSFQTEIQDEMFIRDMNSVVNNFQTNQSRPVSFTVSGILSRTGTQDDGTVFTTLQAAYVIAGPVEGLTALGVRLNTPNETAEISRELETALPGTQAVTSSHLLSTVTDVIHSARVLSFSMVILVLVISLSGVMNSVLMTVYERIREIGVMRAMGASRMDIFRITIFEAIILTCFGGFLGILLVVVFSPVLEMSISKFMPYAPVSLSMGFDPLVALICIGVSVLIGILSGLYPAWKSSRVSPIEAMRN
ncbi:MAG: ABC transporter permease [Desulfonatronovibrio sp. MSAO_Bac4]|nr:MAG: ABC transporter permease [Desulfonatronovibrio sp. MSAO_Bac4]